MAKNGQLEDPMKGWRGWQIQTVETTEVLAIIQSMNERRKIIDETKSEIAWHNAVYEFCALYDQLTALLGLQDQLAS